MKCTRLKVLTCVVILMIVLVTSGSFASGEKEEATTSDQTDPIRIMKYGAEGLDVLFPYVNGYIEDEFMLDVEWVTPNRDTYNERVNITFASGDLPELMDINDYNVIFEAAQNNMLRPIDDVISNHSVWSSIDKNFFTAKKINGSVYSLPSSKKVPDVLVYRSDWAESLGIEEPEGWDAFYEMMRAFTKDDPDGNGKDDTYALTSRYSLINEPIWCYFLPDRPNMLYEENGMVKAVWNLSDEFGKALEELNRAYDEGLIDPEFIVDKKSTHEGKWINGQTGIWTKQYVYVGKRYRKMLELFPEAEVSVVPSVTNEFGRELYVKADNANGLYITKAADPVIEKVKQFYAWFNTTEGYKTFIMGVEGETYGISDRLYTNRKS